METHCITLSTPGHISEPGLSYPENPQSWIDTELNENFKFIRRGHSVTLSKFSTIFI